MTKNTHRLLISLPLRHREQLDAQKALSVEEDRAALFAFLDDKTAHKVKGLELIKLAQQDFKVGTLDSLVLVGEELGRIDQTFETVLDRLQGHLRSLQQIFPEDAAMATSPRSPEDTEAKIEAFTWNLMKYRADLSVKEIADGLASEIGGMDSMVKGRMNVFYQAKGGLDAVERGKSGSLATRDISEVLIPFEAGIVRDSEYMETVGVVLPKAFKSQWESEYQSFAELIVPDSCKLVTEDNESALYIIILFKKIKQDFVKTCSSRKYIVRDISPVQSTNEDKRDEKTLQMELRALWSSTYSIIQSNLEEAQTSHLHLKQLRLFVESVLRYGLPPNYLYLYVRAADGDRALKAFRKRLLQALEALKLPGISAVELATALQAIGGGEGKDGLMDREEQELWTVLNMKSEDFQAFVELSLKLRL